MFAEPLRDAVRDHAITTARTVGLTIEHIERKNFRKEDRVAEVLPQRGDAPGLGHVFSAMEACQAFKPWHDKTTGQDQVKLTVTAPWFAPDAPAALQLEGRATIAGREVVHAAVPAEDMMQAFFYRHLVPARELRVAVARGFGRGGVKILSATPVRIPAGGTAVVRFDAPARAFAQQMQLELSDPPAGISLGKITPASDGTEVTLRADAEKIKPGTKGNLIVKAIASRGPPAGKAKGPGNRQPVATLPAIPFEVVER